MDDFKGSSLASRAIVEEDKKEKKEPIVSADNVTVKKESEVRKFLKPIFQEDIKSVGRYSITEVIVPKVKETIVETFKKAIDFMVWGGSKPSKDSTYYSGEVSYNKYYSGKTSASSYSTRQTPSTTVREIIFKNSIQAEEVLKRLMEDCMRYGSVCVGDFYELTSQPSTLTDQNWGWTDLSGVEIDHVRDGYVIRFPRVVSLKR